MAVTVDKNYLYGENKCKILLCEDEIRTWEWVLKNYLELNDTMLPAEERMAGLASPRSCNVKFGLYACSM